MYVSKCPTCGYCGPAACRRIDCGNRLPKSFTEGAQPLAKALTDAAPAVEPPRGGAFVELPDPPPRSALCLGCGGLHVVDPVHGLPCGH